MAEPEVEEPGALDQVLAWNGVVHVFPRETISMRQDLKYLWMVPALVSFITAHLTWLYLVTKDQAGPLKPSIERIEGSVLDIIRPMYETVHNKQAEILVSLDEKVDDVVQFLEPAVPPPVKELSWKAFDATKSTVDDVQKHGIFGTAKAYVDKYEPVVESYGIQAYKKALTLPLVPEAVACSRYAAVRANNILITVKTSRLPLASFVPLLPVGYFDKITRSGL